MRPQSIEHEKTDVFREQVRYSETIKRRLAEARDLRDGSGADALRAIEAELGPVEDVEAGVLVDLLLSYRAVKDWQRMIDLAERLPEPLGRAALVREQLGFALNRAGRSEEAERVLRALIDERGPSSETYGLLGRVYKDRWEAARQAGERFLARGHLNKAIDAYLRGFEADWRDAYPGINAVTLMEVADPPDPRREEILPVVRYAVERRIATGEPDYWDHATLPGARRPRRRPGRRRRRPRHRPGRRARALGAGDHRPQPAADPRGARGARRRSRPGSARSRRSSPAPPAEAPTPGRSPGRGRGPAPPRSAPGPPPPRPGAPPRRRRSCPCARGSAG